MIRRLSAGLWDRLLTTLSMVSTERCAKIFVHWHSHTPSASSTVSPSFISICRILTISTQNFESIDFRVCPHFSSLGGIFLIQSLFCRRISVDTWYPLLFSSLSVFQQFFFGRCSCPQRLKGHQQRGRTIQTRLMSAFFQIYQMKSSVSWIKLKTLNLTPQQRPLHLLPNPKP